MDKTNILYVQSTEISDVIIESDSEGHNNITRLKDLKYNRLISNRNASCSLRKNIVIINNKDVPNTIIEADNIGHNTVKTFDEYAKEEVDASTDNIFKDLLMKTRQKKALQSNLIDVYLTEKRESLQEKLKRATEFHKKKQYTQANELYENALDSIKYDSYPDEFMLDDCDILAIKFALALSKLGLNSHASLQSAEEILISLIGQHGTKFPSLYYYLAKVYYTLNNYNKAKLTLENGLTLLETLDYLIVINWPGTKDNMVEKSNKDILVQNMMSLLEQCKIYHLPDAKCKFANCQIEHTSIFFKSPDFFGYVSVKCTNKCSIAYHRSCWKKKLKVEGIKKVNCLLDVICATDDCHGLVSEIIIYDDKFKILSTTHSSNKDQKGSKNEPKLRQPHQTEKSNPTKKNVMKVETKPTEKEGKIDKSFDKHDIPSVIQTHFEREIKASHMFQHKTYTLNSNAKEYIPSRSINTSDNSPELSTEEKYKSSSLNTNAKEYVPPLKIAQMLDEKVTYSSEKTAQCSDKFVSQVECDALQCEINILQAELFKTEENYNNLLAEYENFKKCNDRIKSTSDIWTETEATVCDNCVKYQQKLEDKILAVTDVTIFNEQLELKVKELEHEIKELKTSRLLDKEVYAHQEQKFLQSNKVLLTKYQELISEKDKIQIEFEDYKRLTENESLLALKKILLEQIGYSRNFYLSYVAMFENKCKHMIWELEDIKTLTTADSLPSVQEIDENLNMWRQALRSSTQNHAAFILYFENLFEKFTNDTIKDICSSPFPALILEPPSVIHRHFKSFFLVNKRLEQDLNRQMANYYKMLSMPYPGAFPYKMAPSPPIPLMSSESEQSGATAVEPEIKIINPPPGMGGEPVALAQERGLLTVQESQTQEETVQETVPEQQIAETVAEFPEAKAEALPPSAEAFQSEDAEFKSIVVGPDGLMYRLQQRYPLTPPRILQESIQQLRSERGGLSGLDSKTLFGELRIIIADLSKKERQKPGYRKINVKEKPSPWAPVNNGVTWQNTNPRGNCAICFDKMPNINSTHLRCQHVFHTKCIKTWLQNNSICPICRSYTTLDDEFPPLKSK